MGGAVRPRGAVKRFVEAVPHMLNAGDTALHLAAAALKPAAL